MAFCRLLLYGIRCAHFNAYLSIHLISKRFDNGVPLRAPDLMKIHCKFKRKKWKKHILDRFLTSRLAKFKRLKYLYHYFIWFVIIQWCNHVGDCSARYFCINGSASATPTDGVTGDHCPAGHYCESGTTDPTPCPTGTWSASTGLAIVSECTACTGG